MSQTRDNAVIVRLFVSLGIFSCVDSKHRLKASVVGSETGHISPYDWDKRISKTTSLI